MSGIKVKQQPLKSVARDGKRNRQGCSAMDVVKNNHNENRRHLHSLKPPHPFGTER